MFLKLFLKTATSEVTDEEVAYFRDHPDQIADRAFKLRFWRTSE